MSRTYELLLSVALLLGVGYACNDGQTDSLTARQDLASLLNEENLWTSPYYYGYQSRVPVPDTNVYEGWPAINKPSNPSKYFKSGLEEVENGKVEGRLAFSTLGASILNNRFFDNRFANANGYNPFSKIPGHLPLTVNPNFIKPLSSYDSCASQNGEAGICVRGAVCNVFGGRTSGACGFGSVCCINTISACRGTATLNNTYWQSPTTGVSSSSSCSLSIKLDDNLTEQRKPICQLRLDFISFSIAQPTRGACTDSFQVGGATNTVPIICGDNDGQHMYLEVPSSATNPTDLQLMFNFGSGVAIRGWNIKIAMLPCGASYLAPSDCLQYFTTATGKAISFNWKDATGARQLNNQNYNMCFRTELIGTQRATQMCLSVCTTTVAQPFILTTAAGVSAVGTAAAPVGTNPPVATCQYDFLLVTGAQASNNVAAERFCGSALNPAPVGVAASTQICTTMRPFKITYQTDGTELAVVGPPSAAADANSNVGFCLDFLER